MSWQQRALLFSLCRQHISVWWGAHAVCVIYVSHILCTGSACCSQSTTSAWSIEDWADSVLRAAGVPDWVTQRLTLGYTSSQELLQPRGLATLGNYVFCTFYIFGSTGAHGAVCPAHSAVIAHCRP